MNFYHVIMGGILLLTSDFQVSASNTQTKRCREEYEVVFAVPEEINFPVRRSLEPEVLVTEERKVFQLSTLERDQLLENANRGDVGARDWFVELYYEAAIGFSVSELVQLMGSFHNWGIYKKGAVDDHYAFFLIDLCRFDEKIKNKVLHKYRDILINVNVRANKGDFKALHNLGYIYLSGLLRNELIFAAECFRKCAQKEHALSLCALAFMYKYGIGVKQDETSESLLLSKAKRMGFDYAEYALARLEGIGSYASVLRKL
jgi:hypothetical protein